MASVFIGSSNQDDGDAGTRRHECSFGQAAGVAASRSREHHCPASYRARLLVPFPGASLAGSQMARRSGQTAKLADSKDGARHAHHVTTAPSEVSVTENDKLRLDFVRPSR